MKKATKKTFNLHGHIRSSLRRVWLWSPVHKEAKAAARVRYGVYRCASCKTECPASKAEVDHKIPVTPLEGIKELKDWGPAIVRMFDLKNHQVLCESCHSKKTKTENEARRKLRTGKK